MSKVTSTLIPLLFFPLLAQAQAAPSHPLLVLDLNKNGVLSSEEIMLGKRPELMRLDSNRDGELSQDELPRGDANKSPATVKETPPRGLLAYFKSADSDGNGSLNRDEFGRGFAGKDEQFDKLDRNKDGQLSPAELTPRKTDTTKPPVKTP
jgi:hypothetical protein